MTRPGFSEGAGCRLQGLGLGSGFQDLGFMV